MSGAGDEGHYDVPAAEAPHTHETVPVPQREASQAPRPAPLSLPQLSGQTSSTTRPPPDNREGGAIRDPAVAVSGDRPSGAASVTNASSSWDGSQHRPTRPARSVGSGHSGPAGGQLPPIDHPQQSRGGMYPAAPAVPIGPTPPRVVVGGASQQQPLDVSPSAASSSARTRPTVAHVSASRARDRGPVASVPGATRPLGMYDAGGAAVGGQAKTWSQWQPQQHPGDAPAAPLSMRELIGELLGQNQLLESRLLDPASASGSAVEGAAIALPVRMCEMCEDLPESDAPRQRAVFYCEECRRMGYASDLCEACWADEHRSRRTRDHARLPIPLVAEAPVSANQRHSSPGAQTDADLGSSGASSTVTAIDARAVLGLQQHVLNLLLHVMPHPRSDAAAQTEGEYSTSSGGRPPAGQARWSESELIEMLLVAQLEHDEIQGRLMIENAALSELLVASLQHNSFAVSEVQILMNTLGRAPSGDHSASADEVPPAGPGGGRPPLGRPPLSPPRPTRRGSGGGGASSGTPHHITRDVEFVIGEKHLPGQAHQLLVKFADGGAEGSWVHAVDVQDQRAVRHYMSRKMTPDLEGPHHQPPGVHSGAVDSARRGPPHHHAGSRDLSPPGAFEALADDEAAYQSRLGDTERNELAAQLAELKRLGTAGSLATASRGTILGDENAFPPPPSGRDGANDDLRSESPNEDDEVADVAANHPDAAPARSTPRKDGTPQRHGVVKFKDDGETPSNVSTARSSSNPNSARAQTSHSPRRSPGSTGQSPTTHTTPRRQVFPVEDAKPADKSPSAERPHQPDGSRPADRFERQPSRTVDAAEGPAAGQQQQTAPAAASSAAARRDEDAATPSMLPETPPPRLPSQQPHHERPPAAAPTAPAASASDMADKVASEDPRTHTPSGAAAAEADRAVVRRYEQRVKLLEERQRQVRQMREEQEERLRQLREKQLAKGEDDRQKIHEEYEANRDVLAKEQPEVEHPLYLTNDRHAALLLHKLNAEIAQAENERVARDAYRQARQRERDAEKPDDGKKPAASSPPANSSA